METYLLEYQGVQFKHQMECNKKIQESACDIICIEEMKRELFDQAYIKKFCTASFYCFEYVPSWGVSRGILTV
jgi:hypothetical protein